MALGGFATGALVTAPVVATLTWLAVTWQQHVDIRVERDTVTAQAERASFNAKFDQEWARSSGHPATQCDPAATAEIARLRARQAELEARLTGSSATLERNAADLNNLMNETHP